MYENIKWLQLFTEGEGGAAAGEANGPDAGDLAALGVPEEKVRKWSEARKAMRPVAKAATQDAGRDDTSNAETGAQTGEAAAEAQEKRATWEELMQDPEYNRKMQETIQGRVKKLQGAQDELKALKPALEMLGRHYGLERPDAKAISEKLLADNSFYAEKARQLNIEPETARMIDQMQMWRQQREQQEQEDIQERTRRENFQRMYREAEELKQTFPDFDLMRELQENPDFVRRTEPGVGMSVADAYFSCHRAEIMEAERKRAAEEAAKRLSQSMRQNQSRPKENGQSSTAASTGEVDIRKLSPADFMAMAEEMKRRAANGEKVGL